MTTTVQHSIHAIDAAFEKAHSENRAAFIPYFPVGYPNYDRSVDVLEALAEAGADVIEIGVPFSDPMADGPTIQAASQMALENGTTLGMCIQGVADLRARGVTTPIVLMGYFNPFMAYGLEKLVADVKAAGVDGFIIPDLPADEADGFQPLIDEAELGIAYFLAPTSSPERIRLTAEKARGYIYLASLTGITGSNALLPQNLVKKIAEIRLVASKPIAVGFGIKTPENANEVGKIADGVIVGTALVKAGGESVEAARELAQSLRDALG